MKTRAAFRLLLRVIAGVTIALFLTYCFLFSWNRIQKHRAETLFKEWKALRIGDSVASFDRSGTSHVSGCHEPKCFVRGIRLWPDSVRSFLFNFNTNAQYWLEPLGFRDWVVAVEVGTDEEGRITRSTLVVSVEPMNMSNLVSVVITKASPSWFSPCLNEVLATPGLFIQGSPKRDLHVDPDVATQTADAEEIRLDCLGSLKPCTAGSIAPKIIEDLKGQKPITGEIEERLFRDPKCRTRHQSEQ
jgi:hypothetical protein